MAEVKMEQDASHQLNFGVDADEDLINYESDIADKHETEHDVSWNIEPIGSDAKEVTEVQLGAAFDLEDTNDKTELESFSVEAKNLHEQDLLGASNDSAPVLVEAQTEDLLLEHEGADGSVNGDGEEYELVEPKDFGTEHIDFFVSENQDAAVPEDHSDTTGPSGGDAEDSHEIDYDLNENDAEDEPGKAQEPSLEKDPHVARDSSLSQPALSDKGDFPVHQDHVLDGKANQTEEDEITWEEGDAIGASNSAGEDGVNREKISLRIEGETLPDHEVDVDESNEIEQLEDTDFTEEMETGHEDHLEAESGQNEVSPAGLTSGKASAASPGEQQDTTTNHSESENQDFPDITVQYKGDEFPFFSGSSEGFFTELAVLDDDIKSLMAGFRTELTNEIASDEELVFQVDELGLEFSESSLHEALSGITLRQIIEVFDLLVKNQDPDSSRVLYTYLFTRPSTTKRFESLIESATAGKGLDEVIHLFASPVPHGNRVVIGETHAAENYDEDLDTYESAEDMKELDEEDIAEDTTEQAAEELDALHYEEQDIELDNESQNGSESNSHTLAPPIDDESDSAPTRALDVMEAGENGQSATEEATGNPGLNESNGVNHNISISNADEEMTTDDARHPDEEAPADDSVSESGFVQQNAVDTSTTNTLEDDGEAKSPTINADLDFTADHEFTQESLDEQDELAEIDWRHEVDDADESLDTTLGAGKRPRTDDELGVDDDKDVKRLRS